MGRTVTALLVASTVVAAADAAAQAPVQSFSDLLTLVEPGKRVIVREDDGRTSRGDVVSVHNDQLEIRWRRWLFQRRSRTISADSVRSIEIQDSDWNGTLLGIGIGIATGMVIDSQANNEIWGPPLGAYMGAWIGAGIGGAVDRAVNRRIYSPPPKSRLTVFPFIGTDRVGFGGIVGF